MASPEFYDLVKRMRARPRQLDQTVDQSRANFEAMSRNFKPAADASFERVDADGVAAEWVSTEAGKQLPVILFFHGGGYCIGSAETHRDLVSRLCTATGARALSVDYRLAPENPFPAAVDDGVAAYRWLRRQGVPASSIVIAGDSAGGGLTLATLLALKEAGDELPAGGVCMSPVTDHTKSGESMRTKVDLDPMVHPTSSTANSNRYLGGADARTPLASPLYADLEGMPPALFSIGTRDPLLDDTLFMQARWMAAGNAAELAAWSGGCHVFPRFESALTERALDRIDAFMSGLG